MLRVLTITILFALSAAGQYNFDAAHVNHFFSFIADGPAAGASDRWNTQFRFVNLNSVPAKVKLYFSRDSGSPVELDFGSVRSDGVIITVPANGTATASTLGNAALGFSGWAWAVASVPVQATATACLRRGEVTVAEVGVEGIHPALLYALTVQKQTVVSAANIFMTPVTVGVTLHGASGAVVARRSLEIPGGSRTAFAIADLFPEVSSIFVGNLRLEGATAEDFFVAGAVTVNRAGAIEPVRLARNNYPASQWDRIELVYTQVLHAARTMFPDEDWDDIELDINGDREINPFAANGEIVQINLALAELISDSESELAFVIAHELGHINQQRTRRLMVWAGNAEFDADAWGLMLSLAAGFDPYAASGALSKLEMASGRAGLVTQFEQQMSADAHKSFNTRLQNVYDLMMLVCGLTPANKAACDAYRNLFHPHLPEAAPLRLKPGNPVMLQKDHRVPLTRAGGRRAVPLGN